MEKKIAKKENEKKTFNKPQEHLDYAHIENLRKQAWTDPEVKKNWEEFDKKQQKENG